MISIIFLVISLLIIIAGLFLGKGRFALLIVAVCLLANIVSIALYFLAPALSDVKIAIATREVSIYMAVLITLIFIKNFRLPIFHPIDKIYYLLLLTYFAFILISLPRFSLSALLMGRELIFPIATYFLFRFLNLDAKAIKAIIYFVIGLAALAAVLAIFEQVYINFINSKLWEQINISGYLSQKYGSFAGSYPGSWVNYLPVFINFPPGFRSIGIMLDPLATGHFLACSFAIVISWYKGRYKRLLALVIGAGAICTFSKATFLICFIAIGSQALKIRPNPLKQFILGSVLLAILGTGVLLLSTGDDNFTHFGSFRAGVVSLITSPLGHGIGSTGYLAILVTGEGSMEAIDTSFSVYIFQMGIIGLIALLCLIILPFFYLLLGLRHTKQNFGKTPLLPVCLPIFGAYSILAFSSAAAFTAIPVFIPMMLLGMHVSIMVGQAKADGIVSKHGLIMGKVEYAK